MVFQNVHQFNSKETKDAAECAYGYVRNILTLSEAKYRYSDERIEEIRATYACYESSMAQYYEKNSMVPLLILPDSEALSLRVKRLKTIKQSSFLIEEYLRFSAQHVHATTTHSKEELEQAMAEKLFGFGVGPKAYEASYIGEVPEGKRDAFELRYYFFPRDYDREAFRASIVEWVESSGSKETGLFELFCPTWLKESTINCSDE